MDIKVFLSYCQVSGGRRSPEVSFQCLSPSAGGSDSPVDLLRTHSCSFVPASWPPSTFTQAFVVTGVISFDLISILQCDNDQSDAPSAICQQLIRLV